MAPKNIPVKSMLTEVSLLATSLLLLLQAALAAASKDSNLSIRMPDIRPDHAEQYLCIAHRVPRDQKGHYIVGFNPKSDAHRVHHMLMYACEEPGIFQRDSPNFVWDCGEMQQSSAENNKLVSFERGPVCNPIKTHKIMYGWAMDAPALKLPQAVGFKVGGRETRLNFLVLQVHYGDVGAFQSQPDLTDNSGIILDLKRNDKKSGITKQAGVLVLISTGKVLKGRSNHDVWCDIDEDIDIHPFRYRVHTHKLGTKVMGAKIGGRRSINEINGSPQQDDHHIIGQGDPRAPQMFYPVSDDRVVIRRGDTIFARCEFNNNQTRVVNIGPTGDDEMCNFYIMYWTNSQNLFSRDSCVSLNPRNMFSSIW